jgi:hypothetical protein
MKGRPSGAGFVKETLSIMIGIWMATSMLGWTYLKTPSHLAAEEVGMRVRT